MLTILTFSICLPAKKEPTFWQTFKNTLHVISDAIVQYDKARRSYGLGWSFGQDY